MTVEQIQCLLTYLGYNPGAVDGVNGLKTAAAVLVFPTAGRAPAGRRTGSRDAGGASFGCGDWTDVHARHGESVA